MMCEVHRLLRPGGLQLVVSFRARGFLERLLTVPALGYQELTVQGSRLRQVGRRQLVCGHASA